MSSEMIFKRVKLFAAIFGGLLTLTIIAVGFWFYQLEKKLDIGHKKPYLDQSVEFFSAPTKGFPGQSLNPIDLEQELQSLGFRKRTGSQRILAGDYFLSSSRVCSQRFELQVPDDEPLQCLAFKTKSLSSIIQVVLINGGVVESIWNAQEKTEIPFFELEPKLFAQYHGDKPILNERLELSEYPNHCLNAVLSIEDPRFLRHKGISFKGIARAIYGNFILRNRAYGGGSTITQQLIKNQFLSHKRSLWRKAKEIGMAVIYEMKWPKDRILESYLNIIYMGQSGPFVLRGFGAASRHYFNKPIGELNLQECALLAAVLNSPGLFDPFRKKENALKRRKRVLNKMLEAQFIEKSELDNSVDKPLPQKSASPSLEQAPYFVDAVRKKMRGLGIANNSGLRVYTTMNVQAQKSAEESVKNGLQALEDWFKHLQENVEKKIPLQGALVAANPHTGEIEALVGGRDFAKYPYNRATRAHRQVGSIMKPFVYLAALEGMDEEGTQYTPLSVIEDKQFSYEYEGQSWSPKNFDEEFRGKIPMFWGLIQSINASTASLGISVGLESIIDVARRLGLESKLKPLPAMTLGAFELYPLEVLKPYVALARLGSVTPLTLIRSVRNQEGQVLFQHENEPSQGVAKETAAVLVGMMKQTVLNGTGRGTRKAGFSHPAAGKTGTTTDSRDSWFAGFTPHHVAVVWVGYDLNLIHGLTGATGAAPIWSNYMKAYAARFPQDDFPWPETVEQETVSPEDLSEFEGVEVSNDIELIFRAGNFEQ